MAYSPWDTGRVYVMLDLICGGAEGHGTIHLLCDSAKELGWSWTHCNMKDQVFFLCFMVPLSILRLQFLLAWHDGFARGLCSGKCLWVGPPVGCQGLHSATDKLSSEGQRNMASHEHTCWWGLELYQPISSTTAPTRNQTLTCKMSPSLCTHRSSTQVYTQSSPQSHCAPPAEAGSLPTIMPPMFAKMVRSARFHCKRLSKNSL